MSEPYDPFPNIRPAYDSILVVKTSEPNTYVVIRSGAPVGSQSFITEGEMVFLRPERGLKVAEGFLFRLRDILGKVAK